MISTKIFKRLFFVALTIKALSGLIRILLPYDLPHRWRQIDTVGVSIRYWLRWTVEGEIIAPMLPAVLNSQNAYGITPMEFPLFNLLAAPMFFAGPYWGGVLANLWMFSIHMMLTWLCARLWKDKTLLGLPMFWLCLCLGLLSVSSTYLFRFMPDYASFMLVFLALSWAWNSEFGQGVSKTVANSKVVGISCFLATLGLLMKPTSIVLLAFSFLHPDPKLFLRKNLGWMLVSAGVAVLYYTLGIHWIRGFQDGRDLFAVHLRNPLHSVVEVFSDPKNMFVLLASKLFFAPGLASILLIWPLIHNAYKKDLLKLLLILSLQMLAIFALDGSHSFIHDYYYIACSPILLAIVMKMHGALADSSSRWAPWCLKLGLLLCAIKFFDQIKFETRYAFPSYRLSVLHVDDCQALKRRHSELPWDRGFVFRSGELAFPQIGVCFFEREGSQHSRYGLFSKDETLPTSCRILDQQGMALVAECG